MRSISEESKRLAALPEDQIPYLAIDYQTWLGIQHVWMLERLGIEEDDRLAVAVRALDRIARRPLNAEDVDKYYDARHALEQIGAWAPKVY